MARTLQIIGRVATEVPVLPGAERWIVGATFREHIGTPYTRVFDVHPLDPEDHHQGILAVRPEAWAWYQAQTCPVYLREAHPDVSSSRAYPLHAISDRFGVRAGCALSSSIDHMLALALLEGDYNPIRLEGVRMMSLEEWATQRECLAYWIGRAEQMGVEVIADPIAALCVPERLYGFGTPTGARRAPGSPVLVYAGGA